MSYAQRKQMSSNRIMAIIVVALIHVALGYVLVTGLAYNVGKKMIEDLKTFDVEDEPPPPPDEPPPPPEQIPDTPPPVVRAAADRPDQHRAAADDRDTRSPRRRRSRSPRRRRRRRRRCAGSSRRRRAPTSRPISPTTIIRIRRFATRSRARPASASTSAPTARVSGCTVTASSGSAALDSATCRLLRSRARFTPATDSTGAKTSDSVSGRIRWVLPAD